MITKTQLRAYADATLEVAREVAKHGVSEAATKVSTGEVGREAPLHVEPAVPYTRSERLVHLLHRMGDSFHERPIDGLGDVAKSVAHGTSERRWVVDHLLQLSLDLLGASSSDGFFVASHADHIRRGIAALRDTEFAGLIPPAVIDELAAQPTQRATGPYAFKGIDLQAAANQTEPVMGPYESLRRARQLKAEGLTSQVLSQNANPGLEDSSYAHWLAKAEKMLGFPLPAGTLLQDSSVLKHLYAAKAAAERIPVAPDEQRRLLLKIYFQRLIPHDDSMFRPRGGLAYDHVLILGAIADAYRGVDLPPPRLAGILERFLDQTPPSFIGSDMFLTNELVPTLQAMTNRGWTDEQMLMILHAGAQVSGDTARMAKALRELDGVGGTFEGQLEHLRRLTLGSHA